MTCGPIIHVATKPCTILLFYRVQLERQESLEGREQGDLQDHVDLVDREEHLDLL